MTEAVLGLIEAMRNMEPPWNYNSKEKINKQQTNRNNHDHFGGLATRIKVQYGIVS